jgi:hypothetical protein
MVHIITNKPYGAKKMILNYSVVPTKRLDQKKCMCEQFADCVPCIATL